MRLTVVIGSNLFTQERFEARTKKACNEWVKKKVKEFQTTYGSEWVLKIHPIIIKKN